MKIVRQGEIHVREFRAVGQSVVFEQHGAFYMKTPSHHNGEWNAVNLDDASFAFFHPGAEVRIVHGAFVETPKPKE